MKNAENHSNRFRFTIADLLLLTAGIAATLGVFQYGNAHANPYPFVAAGSLGGAIIGAVIGRMRKGARGSRLLTIVGAILGGGFVYCLIACLALGWFEQSHTRTIHLRPTPRNPDRCDE